MLHKDEEFETYLAARRYLYVLFQSLTGNEPSIEQMNLIDAEVAVEAWKEACKTQEAGFLARFLEQLFEENCEMLRAEYTQLFIGPKQLKAPPWESVYVTGKRVLFTPETLEVRNYYRSQGFISAAYPQVADDHIAIELDFLAKLAERALAEKEAEEMLIASLKFLQDHLLVWVPKYVEDLQETQASFYPLVAEALLHFLQKDAENLRAILAL